MYRFCVSRREYHQALRLFILLGSLLLCNLLRAQSPAPAALPNLNLIDGAEVRAVARQSDGSVVFAGTFTSVNGVARQNIARMLANGTLDPTWNPGANSSVYALAIDTGGAIYVGGAFTQIGGLTRKYIAKLSAAGSGSADASWNPNPDNLVYCVTTSLVGQVFAGGAFTSIGGQSRRNLARLSAASTGAADASWDPSPDGSVRSMAWDAGDLYVGGNFANIGGQARARLAKVTVSGVADLAWIANADGSVETMAVGSGALYVGGNFNTVQGQSRHQLARLATSGAGALDAVWTPQPNGPVQTVSLDTTSVFVGGYFTQINALSLSYLAKLSRSSAGAPDPLWAPAADAAVLAVAADGAGGTAAAGQFTNIGGQLRLGFAAVAGNASVGAAVDAELPGKVLSVAHQANGGTIVGGDFVEANQLSRCNLLRLNPDGTLDAAWNPCANDQVLAVAVDANAVYAAGYFSKIGGQNRDRIAKLSPGATGLTDPSWNPASDSAIYCLVADQAGSLYVGGAFSFIGGQARSRIAKLSTSGAGLADATWAPLFDDWVLSMALDGNGALYAGGYFLNVDGQPRSYVAKLSASGAGAADANWHPLLDGSVNAIATEGSTSVFLGGYFGHADSQLRSHIAKFAAAGGGLLDSSWNPAGNDAVFALDVDSGALYAGGGFATIGGQSRAHLARLPTSGTGAASDWNPSVDNIVFALTVDPLGTVDFGGGFSQVGGQPRKGLARIAGVIVFRNGFE